MVLVLITSLIAIVAGSGAEAIGPSAITVTFMRPSRRGSRRLRLDDLTPDPQNANHGTDRGRAALEQSLRTHGAGRAVLIDRRGRVIAGNKTVEQARRLGLRLRVVKTDGRELVAVLREDLDLERDPHAKALAIADNHVNELDLTWDPAVLQQLQREGVDLTGFWTPDEFAALTGESMTDRSGEDAVIEPGPTDITRGDLFELGHHRLLCGDATAAEDVTRVLGGATPILMVTDPPYGVAYDPIWRHHARPQHRTAVGRVLNDDRAEWTAAWQRFPGRIALVWHAGLPRPASPLISKPPGSRSARRSFGANNTSRSAGVITTGSTNRDGMA
jgi:hypothetical protein